MAAVDEERRTRRIRRAAADANRDPRAISLVRRLRGRLPGDSRFGDPLSTAGPGPAEAVARQVSALQPSDPSAIHELGLGALQVWQSLSEAAGRGAGEQELAILFTDLVGFSSWALEAGDEAAVELLREVGCALEPAIDEHHGRIVKRLGDGLMAVFADPADAVDAAFAAREAVARVEVAGHRPRMRAGVHLGRPRRLGGDYLGVDVNIAARVGDAAKDGEVLASDQVVAALDPSKVAVGRARRLRAAGAPRELRVSPLDRIA